MIGEIDKDFYCTSFLSEKVTERNLDGSCVERIMCKAEGTYLDEDFCCSMCTCKKRKYPTPGQFEKEYGYEWEGLIYLRTDYPIEKTNGEKGEWKYDEFKKGTVYDKNRVDVVCACTPFGIPPKDWRPE